MSPIRVPLSASGADFVSEWDEERNIGLDPREIGLADKRKHWWLGTCGHSWQASIPSRLGGAGCAVCAGKQVMAGINDLATTHPEIASTWDYTLNPSSVKPEMITRGSNKKYFWKCMESHSYVCSVANRVNGTGCPFCSGRRVASDMSLASVHPDLALEWSSKNAFSPSHVGARSGKKVNWVCKKGHEWETTVNSRAVQGTGCPMCWGRIRVLGENDAATLLPHLLKEFDEEKNGKPLSFFGPSSEAKLWWRCPKDHSYRAQLANRKAGTGCPFCANRKLLVGFNDLATRNPKLASQIDVPRTGSRASEIITGSTRKVWWLCSLGHSWQSTVSNRTGARGSGCPVCSGNQLLVGFNDLKTTNPSLASEWHTAKNKVAMETVSGGSSKKAWWIGKCGHEWEASISSRNNLGVGCPVCAGKIVLPGFNDLASTFPALVSEWDHDKNAPLKPIDVTASSGRKFWWRCPLNHSWRTDVSHRVQGRGCPTCAQGGFDPNSPGYLYFLWHELWGMYQIGITNFPDDRLARHKRNGFVLLEIRGPMDGHLTAAWENAILKFLKSQGADLRNSNIAGKFDGFSESWSRTTFAAENLNALMRQTEQHEARSSL